MNTPLRIAALALIVAPHAPGQSLQEVYVRGQALPGGDEVSTTDPHPIPFAQVHSNGDIFAFVRTEANEDVLIYDNQLVAREKQPAPFNGFSNAAIDEILHAYYTESERLAWIVRLELSEGNADMVVVAVDDEVIEMEGMPALIPGVANSTWASFDFVHLSEDHTKLTLQGTVQGASPNDPQRKVRVVEHLDSNLNVVARERVILEDGTLTGLPTGVAINSVRGSGPSSSPANPEGRFSAATTPIPR